MTGTLITGTAQRYDASGRISEVSVDGIASPFQYGYMTGTDLQSALAMPNGVTRQTTYDPHRDVLNSVSHTNAAGTVLARRTYGYDAAGRLTNRIQHRLGDETNRLDAFGYNARSELTSAALGTNDYAYAFDPVGNRMVTTENTETTEYLANELNQYSQISVSFVPSVVNPTYDLDGNQTLVRTTTGIWHVTYNAENRPVLFSNDTAVIEMAYDYQGRRFEYKETVSGSPTRHERYLYRGYLQLAALDMLDQTNVIRTVAWDPSEPVATRPLALQTPSGWFTYGLDQVKNVTELFDASGTLAVSYDYSPFGQVTSFQITQSGTNAITQFSNPLTFSSEIADTALGLQYYNYRHLNTLDGRWINRDPMGEKGALNLFLCCLNAPELFADELGEQINDPPATVDAPCCGGTVYDDKESCCLNNEIVSRNSPPVSTGVKKCCQYGRQVLGSDWGGRIPQHCWIEFPGGSTGFYPKGGKISGGRVKWPKDPAYRGTSEECEKIDVSPCDGDATAFTDCISQEPAGEKVGEGYVGEGIYKDGFYILGIRDCGSWADDLISTCRAKTRR